MPRHRLNSADRNRRRGDRRYLALDSLAAARITAERDRELPESRRRGIAPWLTPLDFAAAWRVHPSSAFRVLERLRRSGAVKRAGEGVAAHYEITDEGAARLGWYEERGEALKQFRSSRGKPSGGRKP